MKKNCDHLMGFQSDYPRILSQMGVEHLSSIFTIERFKESAMEVELGIDKERWRKKVIRRESALSPVRLCVDLPQSLFKNLTAKRDWLPL